MDEQKIGERRRYPRTLLRVLVDFESADTYLYDYSNDLSEGGIFIETDKPFPVGSPMTLRFTLPNVERVFEAKGQVAWLNTNLNPTDRPKPHLGNGMGIEFLEMDETDRTLLRDYVLNCQTRPTRDSA